MHSKQEKINELRNYLESEILINDKVGYYKKQVIKSLIKTANPTGSKYINEEFFGYLYQSISESENPEYQVWCLKEAFNMVERFNKEIIKSIKVNSRKISSMIEICDGQSNLNFLVEDDEKFVISDETTKLINRIMK